MKKVAIIIPYYKNDLSDYEKLSLEFLKKNLNKYDKFFVVPEKLKKINSFSNAVIERFPNEYFKSTDTYSRLLCQSFFYERFLNYEYILIYQLDALVLKDELKSWCGKNYDYIGAPLFNSRIGQLTSKNYYGGNGGLSLRKVSSAIRVIKNAELVASRSSNNIWMKRSWFIKALILGQTKDIWLNAPPTDYPFNEDGFWSFEASKYYKEFKVAPFKEALKFSFERMPEKCFKLNKKQLPFGCHAWFKYGYEFWKKYLPNFF